MFDNLKVYVTKKIFQDEVSRTFIIKEMDLRTKKIKNIINIVNLKMDESITSDEETELLNEYIDNIFDIYSRENKRTKKIINYFNKVVNEIKNKSN